MFYRLIMFRERKSVRLAPHLFGKNEDARKYSLVNHVHRNIPVSPKTSSDSENEFVWMSNVGWILFIRHLQIKRPVLFVFRPRCDGEIQIGVIVRSANNLMPSFQCSMICCRVFLSVVPPIDDDIVG